MHVTLKNYFQGLRALISTSVISCADVVVSRFTNKTFIYEFQKILFAHIKMFSKRKFRKVMNDTYNCELLTGSSVYDL